VWEEIVHEGGKKIYSARVGVKVWGGLAPGGIGKAHLFQKERENVRGRPM